jgi:hypothetical protein
MQQSRMNPLAQQDDNSSQDKVKTNECLSCRPCTFLRSDIFLLSISYFLLHQGAAVVNLRSAGQIFFVDFVVKSGVKFGMLEEPPFNSFACSYILVFFPQGYCSGGCVAGLQQATFFLYRVPQAR